MQHLQEVLNRPGPEDPANLQPVDADLLVETNPPAEEDIRRAIKSLKNRKAPGIDNIHTEMLKADINTTSRVLTDLFRSVWEQDTIPEDWCKGLIVKLPKKGDLQNCDNWRGITLLSIPSKVFCKVLLGRIDEAIDSRLREEQAGFRRGRGWVDQIFALGNTIELVLNGTPPAHKIHRLQEGL